MIIAVDFDGVLVEDKFPKIGRTHWDVVQAVRKLMLTNHELILWTSRVDERLEEAVRWCEEHGLKFVAVNSNSPNNLAQYGTDPRKVYADVYIDDRVVGFSRSKAVRFMNDLFNEEDIYE